MDLRSVVQLCVTKKKEHFVMMSRVFLTHMPNHLRDGRYGAKCLFAVSIKQFLPGGDQQLESRQAGEELGESSLRCNSRGEELFPQDQQPETRDVQLEIKITELSNRLQIHLKATIKVIIPQRCQCLQLLIFTSLLMV